MQINVYFSPTNRPFFSFFFFEQVIFGDTRGDNLLSLCIRMEYKHEYAYLRPA